MKRWVISAIVASSLFAGMPASTDALEVSDPTQPPALSAVPVLVSALSLHAQPAFIELYNQTDKAVDLTGWTLTITLADEEGEMTLSVALQDRFLLGKSYYAIGEQGVVSGADEELVLPSEAADMRLESIELYDSAGTLTHNVTDITPRATTDTWALRKTGSAGLTAAFSDSFTLKKTPPELRGNGWRTLPSEPPQVRIVEIIANPARCAPNDASLVCGDYVKLYNPTAMILDLAAYRLRTDSGVSESGNAISLPFALPAYGYLTVSLRDDGAKLSLTNDGGYIWLEDAGGIMLYEETMTAYPSMSSTSKQGWAWAWREQDGDWGWTSTPQPDAPNMITQPVPSIKRATSSLSTCPAGKFRNPDTNRCKSLTTNAQLTPCQPGQARNPATNRCRSAISANASLTPCKPGQDRNPATNRCRSTVLAAQTLTPCQPGQERNPATNRCRKTAMQTGVSSAVAQFEAEGDSRSFPYGSLLLGGMGVAAVGYGAFEWRYELMRLGRRVFGIFAKS